MHLSFVLCWYGKQELEFVVNRTVARLAPGGFALLVVDMRKSGRALTFCLRCRVTCGEVF